MQVLGFLAYNPVDALGAVELGKDEFLLVFNTLGVYVDVHGMKSRDKVNAIALFKNIRDEPQSDFSPLDVDTFRFIRDIY